MTYMTTSLQPIEVLYEDSDLLIVDKPPGLLTVPGRGPDKQDCLIHRITGHDNIPYSANRYWESARIVHRLDMATSGIVIIALNHPAQAAMGTLFSERKISKQYTAIVDAEVTQAQIIELPLICDWDNRPKQKVDHLHGKHAKTDVIPISYCQKSQTSRLKLIPITGRSHQLRVHMLAIGHPIVGDYFYAPEPIKSNSPRLLLHAETIAFIHPVSQKEIVITSPAPF
ncbi:MAG: tRNA pseudouridine32 synthase/23S rRNA pseudouridine746 synthase [Candidatus Endobugula sp.]|jgi:tRNA pseudouridine32 synthase/23S rRNA pseudouridine746 synthase